MTVLVLSGTREGRDMAAALHARGTSVIASLAGATRSPRDQHVPTRIGGFGGADGFKDFLRKNAISAVLDATHPFAAQITQRSADICAQLSLPYCLYNRPEWVAAPDDLWTPIQHESEAAAHIKDGSVVFLATGRQSLARFTGLDQCYLICRQIDPPDAPFPTQNGEYLIGNPPFDVKDEGKLFEKRNVDWLVVKNSGGTASLSKLIAARQLRVPVLMLARPATPNALCVSSQDEALSWAAQFGAP